MRAGPLYMTLAGLMFTVMVAAVKVARQELPALEVIWWRAAISLPLSYLLARRVGLALVGRRVFAYRVVFGFTAMVCFYIAAKGLAVTDLSILHKLQPILIGVFAPLILGRHERAGVAVWLLVAAGMIGCAILLAPELEVGNTYGLWALGGAAASALAHVFVRALGTTDDPRVLVTWFMAVTLAISSAALVATTGALVRWPSPELLGYLVAVGVTATAGQMLMTLAYKRNRAPVVAAAAYSAPLWAVGIDVVAFDAVPGPHALIGGAIVVAAGLILLLRKEPPATIP